MGRPKLSLLTALTPTQRAKNELEALTATFSESLEIKILKLMFVRLTAIEKKVDELTDSPKRDPEEFVNARYVAKRFGLNSTAATELMHRIGVLRVGPRGGSLRVRMADVDRFAQAPEQYEVCAPGEAT